MTDNKHLEVKVLEMSDGGTRAYVQLTSGDETKKEGRVTIPKKVMCKLLDELADIVKSESILPSPLDTVTSKIEMCQIVLFNIHRIENQMHRWEPEPNKVHDIAEPGSIQVGDGYAGTASSHVSDAGVSGDVKIDLGGYGIDLFIVGEYLHVINGTACSVSSPLKKTNNARVTRLFDESILVEML